MEVIADRKEIEQHIEEYEEDQRAQKQREEVQRLHLLQMVRQNIQLQHRNTTSQEKMDRATDHLINPKEFQKMD